MATDSKHADSLVRLGRAQKGASFLDAAWVPVGTVVIFASAAGCGGATAGGTGGGHDAGDDSSIASGASGASDGSSAGTSGISTEAGGGDDAATQADATLAEAGPDAHAGAASEAGFGSGEASVAIPDADTDAETSEASTDSGADAGCASGADPTWAEWPMPNLPSDSDAATPNPESCTDNGDGTVTDNVTGLMWQQATTMAGTLAGNPDDQSPTSSAALANAAAWSMAEASCQSLTLAGHDDWHLPTLIELISIDHFGSSPALDPVLFPDPSLDAATEVALFMSDTPEAGSPNVWWIVHAFGGSVGDGAASTYARLLFNCVRVPHQNPTACRFAYPATGTVLDTKTNLTWQQTAAMAAMTEPDAEAYCTASNVSGGGWRLPSARELLTLVNYTASFPLLDQTAFPGSVSGIEGANVYWSSTSAGVLSSTDFLDVRFDLGNTENTLPSQTNAVRCVR
ncbi:MAG TPA: DUF1566 domain-containing protein [Polyangiaceae bacterium]|nr:DUF1566 domain-containing protein [Polyangiaceae bacterium]